MFDALLELIQEKRWDRIRVQDLLDRTGVGRSTFYAHFDNKFDLLTAEIPISVMTIAAAEGEPDLLPLFEHVAEMQPVMRPLMTQPLLGEIVDTFEQRLAEAWDEHLAAHHTPEPERHMASHVLAGSFMTIARRWLMTGCTTSPKELCDAYSRYARVVIAQANADLTEGV